MYKKDILNKQKQTKIMSEKNSFVMGVDSTNGITLIGLIVTIIVLLILAGVSISSITGNESVMEKAKQAKNKTEAADELDTVKLAVVDAVAHSNDGLVHKTELDNALANVGMEASTEEDDKFIINGQKGTYTVSTNGLVELDGEPKLMSDITGLKGSGEVGEIITFNIPANTESIDHYELLNSTDSEYIEITTNGLKALKTTTNALNVKVYGESGNYTTASITIIARVTPSLWEKIPATNANNNWYNYGGKTVNDPVLLGNMKAIKYAGTLDETESTKKWANAMTKDGSMWVWIPRYAYRIQANANGHSNIASPIEVIFVGNNNKDLAGVVKDTDITANPNEQGAATTKYLVHPAFSNDANIGGGFGTAENKGISGFWIAKFESTGTSSALSVKPGLASLVSMTIGEQFTLAKNTTFEEDSTSVLKSHMAKNSEWGAVAYLAHSSYGAATKIENNGVRYSGGVNCTENNATNVNYAKIYTDKKTTSTTHNATGVYDMNGGALEHVASYISSAGSYTDLTQDGSSTSITSTKYKTVYPPSYANLETSDILRGDAIWETSNGSTSWEGAFANYPVANYPFFIRSGAAGILDIAGIFFFSYSGGNSGDSGSFRVALCP